jgi:D-inositol-3-phosphate glycosyltransferase
MRSRYLVEIQVVREAKFFGPSTHYELAWQFQRSAAHVLLSVYVQYYFEGFGFLRLEADLCGALTIGTEESANEEIIEEGINGFLVPQNNPTALADAMRAAERVRQQCVEHARKFSWEDRVQSIRQSYQMLTPGR